MASYILDKAYSIDEAAGVAAYRVVVHGANAGQAKLPSAGNQGAILGVTVHSQTRRGANVAVRKAGIARATAAGPIAVGDPVNVADAGGKVKAVNEPAATRVNCLGFAETAAAADGDIIEIFISLHERVAA
jgi:hypothetical protein